MENYLIFTVYRPKSHRQIKSKVVDETLTNRYFFVKMYLSMHKANKQKTLNQNSFHVWMQLPNRVKRIRWKQCLVNGRALLVHCSPFKVPLQVVGSASLCLAWVALKKSIEEFRDKNPVSGGYLAQLLHGTWRGRVEWKTATHYYQTLHRDTE